MPKYLEDKGFAIFKGKIMNDNYFNETKIQYAVLNLDFSPLI